MKLKRLIALVLTVLMIASLTTVCLTANAAEVETAETGALGSYYNVNYLETKAYNGTDLGSTYTPSKTTWKVWSPEAKSIKLNLFATGSDLENGAENLGTHTLTKDSASGVWTVALDGDYKNVYYTYTVETTKLGAMETYDIYAKACGVNGNRSMVVDLDSTDPEGWENDEHVFVDQVTDEGIWEVHIADLTSNDNSGVSDEYQGKFLGFIEGGLTYNGKSTGVDYLVEQGIKAIHIQCPFDFASGDERNNESYNWGYDPKNYNVPEGLYSTNPYDGNVRITEFKQLIQALHDRGISVIMGVVYNHTFGSDQSPFTYTVPGYYYRMESATQYINCTA
ncbi:MAG: type I pullulanase, partial [Ruminococcus sp.]|nr:type I pullulanase [Ruminococcus sp.]